MAENKEPQFFSDANKVDSSMAWYKSLFKGANEAKAIGEASTNYTKYPLFKDVPELIKTHIPHAKLIYIIRNPIERIYSQFTHNYYIGRTDNDLNRVITQNRNYINISKYHMQLQKYLGVFEQRQIKVVLLEDLRDRPKEVVKDIYEYLDVDSVFVPSILNERKHQTTNKSGRSGLLMKTLRNLPFYESVANRLPEDIKGKLNSLFRSKIEPPKNMTAIEKLYLIDELGDDIISLQSYLKRDLSAWLQ